MKHALTLGLAVAFIGLGGYYLWAERKPAPSPEVVSIWSLEDATPSVVTLTGGTKTAVYRQEGKAWRFSGEPRQGLDYRWDSGLSSLLKPSAERKVLENASASVYPDYGLDKPLLKAKLGERTLLVGAKNPAGNAYYAAEEGKGTIYLLSSWQADSWLELVNKPPVVPPTPGTKK